MSTTPLSSLGLREWTGNDGPEPKRARIETPADAFGVSPLVRGVIHLKTGTKIDFHQLIDPKTFELLLEDRSETRSYRHISFHPDFCGVDIDALRKSLDDPLQSANEKADTLHVLGAAYIEKGDFNEAIKLWEEAAAIEGNTDIDLKVAIYFDLGNYLYTKKDDLDGAIQYMRQAHELQTMENPDLKLASLLHVSEYLFVRYQLDREKNQADLEQIIAYLEANLNFLSDPRTVEEDKLTLLCRLVASLDHRWRKDPSDIDAIIKYLDGAFKSRVYTDPNRIVTILNNLARAHGKGHQSDPKKYPEGLNEAVRILGLALSWPGVTDQIARAVSFLSAGIALTLRNRPGDATNKSDLDRAIDCLNKAAALPFEEESLKKTIQDHLEECRKRKPSQESITMSMTSSNPAGPI